MTEMMQLQNEFRSLAPKIEEVSYLFHHVVLYPQSFNMKADT